MVVVVLSDPNEILQKHLQRVKILEVLFCDVWVFWSAGIVCNCRRSQIGLYTYVANNISIGWTRRVYQNRYGHCYRGMPSWHHLSVFVVSITVVSRGALCVYFCVVVCIGDEVCHQFNRRVLVALKNDFSCGDITVWQSTSVKIFNDVLEVWTATLCCGDICVVGYSGQWWSVVSFAYVVWRSTATGRLVHKFDFVHKFWGSVVMFLIGRAFKEIIVDRW